MTTPAFAGNLVTREFNYDFAVDAGAKDVQIDLGDLPANFVPIQVNAVCVTPLASDGSATVEFGNATVTDIYIANEAISSFDTAGKAQSWVVTDCAAATTAALRTFGMLIQTAALTAGALRIYVIGYVADLSTGKKADTTY